MEKPKILADVRTAGDARKLIDDVRGDWALAGCEVAFVTVRPDGFPRRVAAALGLVKATGEADRVPALKEHVCRGCRHALRTPEGRHHILRYVDYAFVTKKQGENWAEVEIQEGPTEVLATACCADMGVPPVAAQEDRQKDHGAAPLVFAAAKECPYGKREGA